MGKIGTMLLGTVQVILFLVTGGIFWVSFKLTKKYGILTAIIPAKYQGIYPDFATPNLFGGLVTINEETLEEQEVEKFTMLHEKGHCRCWRAIPEIGVVIAALRCGCIPGHGEETSDYEYAADLYAAKHGAVDEGLLYMEAVLTILRDDEHEFERCVAKGGSIKDPINRARVLRRWKRANVR